MLILNGGPVESEALGVIHDAGAVARKKGVNAWFSDQVSTAIKDSQAVAQAYLQEHQQHLGDEALAMAGDIQREGPLLTINRDQFEQVLTVHSALRQSTTLKEAFTLARSLVLTWELRSGFEPSNPQIAGGENVERLLVARQ